MNPEGSLQAVWMLLCATCLSSFSRVVFWTFSVPQSNKLMPLTDGLTVCDVESIGLLKSESIGPSMNCVFFFFSCFTDLQVVLSPHVQMEENQVRRHVSFISGFALRDSFWFLGKLKDYSWRLFSTSTNGTIYSALMGSILTQAPGLGSGTGPYP